MNFINPDMVQMWITSPYALAILAMLATAGSSFLFVPSEIMYLPMALAAPNKAIFYGLFVTFFSVLGACFGYFLGKKGGQPILHKLFKEKHIDAVRKLYKKYDTKAVFIGAFSPIPYQAFTLSAGVFDLNFSRFVMTSIIGRAGRFLLVTGLIAIFGPTIQSFIEDRLGLVTALITAGLIILYAFYKIAIPLIEEKWLKRSIKDIIFGWFQRS